MIDTARVIVTLACPNKCPLCVMQQGGGSMLDKAAHITQLSALGPRYSTIILTGGEPLSHPERLVDCLVAVKEMGRSAILYTAVQPWDTVLRSILLDPPECLVGVTYTVHRWGHLAKVDQERWAEGFLDLQTRLLAEEVDIEMRLKIEAGATQKVPLVPALWSSIWMFTMEESCSVPPNEHLFHLDPVDSLTSGLLGALCPADLTRG